MVCEHHPDKDCQQHLYADVAPGLMLVSMEWNAQTCFPQLVTI
jgi:hypothetical protein